MNAISEIAVLLRNGKSVRQSAALNGLPITRIETIADGKINPAKVGFADLEESDCTDWLLQDGDILISHINSTKHLGKCAIYQGDPPALIHGMNLLALRVDPYLADSRYVYWMLSSTGFRRKLPRITKNSVNQSSFNISSFKKLEIPLPLLPEQKRIAGIMDAADALRTKRRDALAQLDTLLQSAFLDMFGDPVTNPMGWEKRELSHLCRFLSGYAWKAKNFNSDQIGSPVIRIQNVGTEFSELIHTAEEPIGRFWVEQGEYLLSLSGSFRLMTWNGPRALLNQRIVKLTPQSIVAPAYFGSALSTQLSAIEAMGRHALVNNVALSDLKKVALCLPPLNLQHRFATIVESIEHQKVHQRAHLTELDTLFASLQSRAFRGDL